MLYIHPRRQQAKTTNQPQSVPTAMPDPWHSVEPEDAAESSSWLLSYADIVTLLFALFVLLCAHQKIMLDQSKVDTAQTVAATSTPVVAEKTPVPASIPTLKATTEILTVAATPSLNEASLTPVTTPAEAKPTEVLPSTLPAQWLGIPAPAATITPPTPLSPQLSSADWNRWVEFSAGENKVRLEVSDKILFDPGSSRLKPEGMLVLDSLANWLRLQGGQIDVEGHTDNAPISTARFDSNWELSSARASAVTRHLIARGLTPERIKAIGLADTQPRDSNDNPEGRARNRRVSLVLYLIKQGGMNI